MRALVGVASLMIALATQGQVISNQPSIKINDATSAGPAKATPYENASVEVTNVLGTLEKVTVELTGLNHTYANDVSVLLVGPGGKAVALMSKAGGGLPVANANVVFDQTVSTALPQFGAITSGSYKPGDYGSNVVTFLAPAPVRPYTTLSAFVGDSPNGKWTLYVQDETSVNDGSIAGWKLNLYTTPIATLSTNNLTVAQNGSGSVTVTLQDSSTAFSGITVTGTSDKTSLIANSGITVTGSGATRTVTVKPVTNQVGTANITLKVQDETSFINVALPVDVIAVNQAPSITRVSNTAISVRQGEVSTNLVTVSIFDYEWTNNPATASNLVLSATSSDTSVVADSPIGVFFAGSGTNQTMTIVPNGAGVGTAKLTLTVSDGGLSTVFATNITVTVTAAAQKIFANAQQMDLTPGVTASSGINILNIPGKIGRVSVALNAVKNFVAANTKLVLQAPNAPAITLLDAAAPTTTNNYAQIRFATTGGTTLPSTDQIAAVTNNVAALATLVNTDPNGVWYLYATNTATGAVGAIAGGWVLDLWGAPTITPSPLANINMIEDGTYTTNFSVASVNGSITNVTIPNPANANITAPLSSGNVTMTIKGKSNVFGTNDVTVTVKDQYGFQTTSTFTLGIAADNDAPTIDFIEKQITRAGEPTAPVVFNVNDIETPAGDLTVTADSSYPVLLPPANIVLQRTATPGQWTATMFPMGNFTGQADVTITVKDAQGATAFSKFTLYVQEAGNPLFLVKTPITINAGAVATPYPSSNYVSGLLGSVAEVDVTLFDVTYPTNAHISALLVGPKGQKVLLMQKAGGTAGLNSTTLIFADSGATTIPDTGTILSGIYKPTVVGTPTDLPAPAPVGPYSTSLDAFKLTDPNGGWLLYVYSDTAGKSGIVRGGWQLSIKTGPKIQDIKDVYTKENLPVDVPIVVGDAQPGVPITVQAFAGDTNLIQEPIAVTGSGSTRVLHVVPVPYKYGTNKIYVFAQDDMGNYWNAEFTIGVEKRDLPPLILTTIPNQTTTVAKWTGNILFDVWDPQTQAGLDIKVASSDPSLLGKYELVKTTNTDGTNTWSLAILPGGVLTGITRITLNVTDSIGLKTSTAFDLTVNSSPVFAGSAIEIPEGWPIDYAGLPYPSTVNVKGLGGIVSKVSVVLDGFTHPFPEDVSVLLVNPDDSKSVMLMAHAGSGYPVSNLRIGFEDGEFAQIPMDQVLESKTYRPAAYNPFILPAPAPQPGQSGYSTSLSDFNGISPNGNWKLYVMDDTFPDGGGIYSGWLLYLETAPAIETIAAQTTPENQPINVGFIVGDAMSPATTLTVTADVVTNYPANMVTTNNLVLSGTGANRTLKITPTQDLPSSFFTTNAPGFSDIKLTVTDPARGLSTSRTFRLTVTYVNQAPIVSTATNTVEIIENQSPNIVFTISDVDSKLKKSLLDVKSSDVTLVPNTTNNIVVTGSDALPGVATNITVKVIPLANKNGSTKLTFVATDGSLTATNIVTLVVKPDWQPPIITNIPNQTIVAGTVSPLIKFTVDSIEVDPATLTVTAVSTNENLIPNRNIVVAGSGKNRTIQYTANGQFTGQAGIIVTVSDGTAASADHFFVTVQSGPSTFFANSENIKITGKAVGSLYPSPITVSGITGGVYKVQARLDGLYHSLPSDLDVLLVSPQEAAVMLMSGAGGSAGVSNLRVTFDDQGQVLGRDQITSATYQPANYTGSKLPNAPTNVLSELAVYENINPNGQWLLYVNNRGTSTGQIAGGWSLTVLPKPILDIVSKSPESMIVDEGGTATVTMSLFDQTTDVTNLTMSATSENQALLSSRSVTFARSGAQVIATLKPEPNQSGDVKVTFTATRADGAMDQESVILKVNAVNTPPVISRISSPRYIDQNGKAYVEFLVSDVDTALATMTLAATSDNPALMANKGLYFQGTSTNVLNGLPANSVTGTSRLILWMQPNAFQSGDGGVTLTVTDPGPGGTNTVIKQFAIHVEFKPSPPFFSAQPPAEVMVASGSKTYPIPFGVASANLPAPTLAVTGQSLDQSLVKNENITIDPVSGVNLTNRTVTIKTEPGVTGTQAKNVTIILTVTQNGSLTATTSFKLVIGPNPERQFANASRIDILDAPAVANPYPSVISVSNLVGSVANVKVTLKDFQHSFPSDVGILLVGPNGKSILMNRAGAGGQGMPPVTLTFEQDNILPIIPSATFTSGSYRPFDYKGGNYSLAKPAPAGPYTADLSVFNDKSANGDWALFVMDDTPGDSGVISNGWALTITTKPIILGLGAMSILENNSKSQPFTVADDSTWSSVYTASGEVVEATGPVKTSGVKVEGSGTNWTVTVTPTANTWGTNTIRVTVQNANGQQAIATFPVTVTYTQTAPSLADLPPKAVKAGEVAVVPLDYSDAHTPKDQLVLTFGSSNTNLVPLANMSLVGSSLYIAPNDLLSGQSEISVSVKNLDGQTTTKKFMLSVVSGLWPTFANNSAITIPDGAAANPYPSTIDVSGVPGAIVQLKVTVIGFQHAFPSDASILLVGPTGKKVVLMSRCGGGVPLTDPNMRITFDDTAETSLPQYSGLTGGNYKPTDYKLSDEFFAPAPPPLYGKQMAEFGGTNPNGQWKLYVQDDASPDSGRISGGWFLEIITTAPGISSVGAQAVAENDFIVVPFIVSSQVSDLTNVVVTASSSGDAPAGLFPAGSLVVSGTGSLRALKITPAANMPSAVSSGNGSSTITLTAVDGGLATTRSFPITVAWINQAPTISGLADTNTPANRLLSVPFTIGDVDSDIALLSVIATNAQPALGAVSVTGTGANRTLSFVPSGTMGDANLTVVVSDGTKSGSKTIKVTLTAPPVALPPATPTLAIMNNGETVDIQVNGTADSEYLIQSSTDMSDWTKIGSVTTDSNGVGTYTAPAKASGTVLFRAMGR